MNFISNFINCILIPYNTGTEQVESCDSYPFYSWKPFYQELKICAEHFRRFIDQLIEEKEQAVLNYSKAIARMENFFTSYLSKFSQDEIFK